MTRIIGFAAPAGGGKDTAGAYLTQHYGFIRISFATPIYDALEAMGFGYPRTFAEKEAIIPELGVSWRKLATTLGTEWGRAIHPDLWIIMAQKKLKNFPNRRFVFTDVRFDNEAQVIREAGGLIIHLTGRSLGTAEAAHASEAGVAVRPADVVLDNSGSLQDLYERLSLALDGVL